MAKNYVIGSGLSESELKAATWWIRHQIGVRRSGYSALIALIIALWGYSAWSLLDAFIISYPRERAISEHIQQNKLASAAFNATVPQPVQTFNVFVFQNTGERQDFLIQISNPNTQWWADFTYHFDLGGETTPNRQSYILPGSQRYLTELGWKGQGTSRNATLVVEKVRWHRLDPRQVGSDYTSFRDQRLQLSFEDILYTRNLTIGNQTIGQSSFAIRNLTGFGFWDVDLTIILFRLDQPVAVTTLNAHEIKPGEVRPVTMNWFENPTAISKTEIHADVNLLDPSAYLPSERF